MTFEDDRNEDVRRNLVATVPRKKGGTLMQITFDPDLKQLYVQVWNTIHYVWTNPLKLSDVYSIGLIISDIGQVQCEGKTFLEHCDENGVELRVFRCINCGGSFELEFFGIDGKRR